MEKPLPLVSVIVPVYNAESTLEKCVNSLLGQHMTDFQLILINDGSKDKSAALCESFRQLDSRVVLIHQDNRGVSAARNTGLERAEGKYICFVDSDDWVGDDYLSNFFEGKPEKHPLVMQNFLVDRNQSSKPKFSVRSQTYQKDHFNELFTDLDLLRNGVAVCKLYHTALIQEYGIRFHQDVHYAEDCLFMLQYLRHSPEVAYIDTAAYHYVQANNESLSATLHSFESELKGYRALSAVLAEMTALLPFNNNVKRYIDVWLGTFFLRPVQAIYRSGNQGDVRARIHHQETAYQALSKSHLKSLNQKNTALPIFLGVQLFRNRQHFMFDFYFRTLLKLSNLKSGNYKND